MTPKPKKAESSARLQWWSSGSALVIGVLLGLSCSDEDDCTRGYEGCRCAGASCLEGLTCLSGRCVDPDWEPTSQDDAGAGSSSDDDGDPTLGMMPTEDGATGMESSGPGGDMLTHSEDIQPIWDAHCVSGCHEPGGQWSLMDLSPGAAYGSLTFQTDTQGAGLFFVQAGQPDRSYLWHKINGTQASAGGRGETMPRERADGSRVPLTLQEFDVIEQWIKSGAPP